MANPPEIKGLNWLKEVGDPRSTPELDQKRKEFYRLKAQRELLKLKTHAPNLNAAFEKPKKYGLESLDDLRSYTPYAKKVPSNVESAAGYRLSEILFEYFKNNRKLEQRANGETFLTIHYLLKQGVKVDLILKGETIEIIAGKLFIYSEDKAGEKKYRVNGISLRPETKEEEPPPPPKPVSAPPPLDIKVPSWVASAPAKTEPAPKEQEKKERLEPLDVLMMRATNALDYLTSEKELNDVYPREHNIVPRIKKLPSDINVILSTEDIMQRKKLLNQAYEEVMDLDYDIFKLGQEIQDTLEGLQRYEIGRKTEETVSTHEEQELMNERIKNLTIAVNETVPKLTSDLQKIAQALLQEQTELLDTTQREKLKQLSQEKK